MFIGIDDVQSTARRGDTARRQKSCRFRTTEAGIQALVTRLSEIKPALIVLEATGGLERSVSGTHGAVLQLPVVVVNPRQVERTSPKALGQLASTDRIDAEVLARFRRKLYVRRCAPCPIKVSLELRSLIARRRQLIEMMVAEKTD